MTFGEIGIYFDVATLHLNSRFAACLFFNLVFDYDCYGGIFFYFFFFRLDIVETEQTGKDDVQQKCSPLVLHCSALFLSSLFTVAAV